MQEQGFQIQVNGIGEASALTISQAHEHFGLSKQECIQRILTSPSVLQSDLTHERAQQLQNALSSFKLPCEIIRNNTTIARDKTRYEIAAHITKFDHVADFAAELAAFTGQTGEEIIRSLTQVPAILLGQLSKTVADDLIKRFSKPGIELIPSASNKAHYSLLAYMPTYSDSIQSQYISFGLKPNNNSIECRQWSKDDLTYTQAQEIWKKASALHLPVHIQNHDYYRFNLKLDSPPLDNELERFSDWLTHSFAIPKKIHTKLLNSLPIILERSISLDQTETYLLEMHQLGAKGNATSVSGEKYHIEFSKLDTDTLPALSNLINSMMGRIIQLPQNINGKLLAPLSANTHQALWIIHEAKKAGIGARLIQLDEHQRN